MTAQEIAQTYVQDTRDSLPVVVDIALEYTDLNLAAVCNTIMQCVNKE